MPTGIVLARSDGSRVTRVVPDAFLPRTVSDDVALAIDRTVIAAVEYVPQLVHTSFVPVRLVLEYAQ